MFASNDNITLSCINVLNKDLKIIDFNLSFPLYDTDLEIPDDVIEVSIFESHLGRNNYGYVVYKICVGEVTSIEEIANSNEPYLFDRRAFSNIKRVDDKLCYYTNSDNVHLIYEQLNSDDIVVKDVNELKMVLINISNNFKCIKEAIDSIRHSDDIMDYSIEEEISENRYKMCLERRKAEEKSQ